MPSSAVLLAQQQVNSQSRSQRASQRSIERAVRYIHRLQAVFASFSAHAGDHVLRVCEQDCMSQCFAECKMQGKSIARKWAFGRGAIVQRRREQQESRNSSVL